MSYSEVIALRRELQEVKKRLKQYEDLTGLFHERYLTMRSRLAVLITLHKNELEGQGFTVDNWLRALELDPKQVNLIMANLKPR